MKVWTGVIAGEEDRVIYAVAAHTENKMYRKEIHFTRIPFANSQLAHQIGMAWLEIAKAIEMDERGENDDPRP